jgi:hypothetical protein
MAEGTGAAYGRDVDVPGKHPTAGPDGGWVAADLLRVQAMIASDQAQSARHRAHAVEAIPSLVRDLPTVGDLERAARAIS